MKTNSNEVYSTQFDLLENRMNCPNTDGNSATEIKSSVFTVDHDGLYDPSDDLAELHWLASFLEEPSLDHVPKSPISPRFGLETKDMDVVEQISDGFRDSISAFESSSRSGNRPAFVPDVSTPGKVRNIKARVSFSDCGTGSLPLVNSNPVMKNCSNTSVSANAAVSTHSDSLSSQQVKSQNRFSQTDRGIETNSEDATRVITCMSCGTRKPPHWIDGPKTLCVACHSKYNTFVGHLHHLDSEQGKCHFPNKISKRNQGIIKKEHHKLQDINIISKRKQGIKKKERGKLQVKKCMHCSIIKTPQWRDGPMGPKTLCNACGMRYRAGKLLPEYRPAASPTFSVNKHSNSHKKVLEIRSQKDLAA